MLREAYLTARSSQTLAVSDEKYAAFKTRYFNDLRGFVHDCILWADGHKPTPYQDEILEKISGGQQRISVRGPHGLGKTAMMAWIVLWFALTRDGNDWKVVTTASAWRQLEKYLWPEIHKWARAIDWRKVGRLPFDRNELHVLKLRLNTGEAFAVASDNPALIEGAHAEYILYIFDESKAIVPATFDAAEGALTTPGAMAVAMSTPGEPNGRFYDIQSKKKGYEDWWTRHVKRQEVIDAGRMTQVWADARKAQWGETSAVYKNRVEGEFAAADEDSVITLAMVERANERWQQIEESGNWGKFVALGADIARSGNNMTALAHRYEKGIKNIERRAKADTMETAGRIQAILSLMGGTGIIDTVGIGAGVYDRLREQNLDVVPFVASGGTKLRDKAGVYGFVNVRSAAWWNLREMLEDDLIALPPDDTLTGDLTAPKWRIMSGGRYSIESKEEIAKRIGRSTDDGDAVVQAFWEGMQTTETTENPLAGYRG